MRSILKMAVQEKRDIFCKTQRKLFLLKEAFHLSEQKLEGYKYASHIFKTREKRKLLLFNEADHGNMIIGQN